MKIYVVMYTLGEWEPGREIAYFLHKWDAFRYARDGKRADLWAGERYWVEEKVVKDSYAPYNQIARQLPLPD